MCSIPAFRALRAALPDTEITLIGLPWARDFVDRFHRYLDHFIEFPGYPGLPERDPDINRIPEFISEVQNREIDLMLQLQGSGSITNSLVMLFGAKNTAGYYLPGSYCPDKTSFLSYPVHEPEIFRHLELMESLGFPSQGEHLEFPITDVDRRSFYSLPGVDQLLPQRFICIHPGARAIERRWPTQRFAAVGDMLASRGYRLVLTGSADEEPITQEVARAMTAPVIDLAGKTSLGSLAVLLSRARMLICNDTGVSHIADALDVPSIILFTTSDPDRWAPIDQRLHRVIGWAHGNSADAVMIETDDLLNGEVIYAG
jgi:ADP-heptose:LPS heptosyltransferase